MKLLGLDFETTGFDTAQDRIIEVGAVLWDARLKQPLDLFSWVIYEESIPPLSEEIARITGLRDQILREHGTPAPVVFEFLDTYCERHSVDYIVAHNGENFDKPILTSELKRHGLEDSSLMSTPWLDTRQDIPFEVEPDSRKLKHLIAEHGFLNPFPHRAVFDAVSMMKLLSFYDIEKVVAYSKTPWITVRACVNYDERQLAKDKRYSWQQLGTKVYEKKWVKRIKADKLELEQSSCPFPVEVLE